MYFLENRKRDGTDGTDGTDPYFFIKKEGNIVLDTENRMGYKAGQTWDKRGQTFTVWPLVAYEHTYRAYEKMLCRLSRCPAVPLSRLFFFFGGY